jgi:hypothetical protein
MTDDQLGGLAPVGEKLLVPALLKLILAQQGCSRLT